MKKSQSASLGTTSALILTYLLTRTWALPPNSPSPSPSPSIRYFFRPPSPALPTALPARPHLPPSTQGRAIHNPGYRSKVGDHAVRESVAPGVSIGPRPRKTKRPREGQKQRGTPYDPGVVVLLNSLLGIAYTVLATMDSIGSTVGWVGTVDGHGISGISGVG